MAGPDDVPRRAGRVLPVDPSGRLLLLLLGFDPADPGHPFWFTVGGGAEPGESLAEAAARELREEVIRPRRLPGASLHGLDFDY